MTLDEAIRRNPYDTKRGNESTYCRYLRYNVDGWYQFDSKEVLRRWQKTIATDYAKCLSCRWRDVNNVQCFDGHLQMPNKKECEGYEYSVLSEKIKFEVQESKK